MVFLKCVTFLMKLKSKSDLCFRELLTFPFLTFVSFNKFEWKFLFTFPYVVHCVLRGKYVCGRSELILLRIPNAWPLCSGQQNLHLYRRGAKQLPYRSVLVSWPQDYHPQNTIVLSVCIHCHRFCHHFRKLSPMSTDNHLLLGSDTRGDRSIWWNIQRF